MSLKKSIPDLYKSGTLLIVSGPKADPNKRHLFVICTKPCANKLVILAPIASWINDRNDATCLLEPFEHSFLKRKSYVAYRFARIESTATIDAGLNSGEFICHDRINTNTLLRITNGICSSSQTPGKIKKYHQC